jgi:DnaK suppressor protein
MRLQRIAEDRKQFHGNFRQRRGMLTDGDLSVAKARRAGARRRRAAGQINPFTPSVGGDQFNPFTPPVGGDPPRPPRETTPAGLQIDSQRRALLALRARLQGNVAETLDSTLSGCGIEATCSSPDTADRAGEIVEQDLALSLLGNANGTLEQIDAALRNIENGSYGRCVQCDARIPAARLEAIPYATCCVQCAARQEHIA